MATPHRKRPRTEKPPAAPRSNEPNKLSDEARAFIVTSLAMFQSPTAVQQEVLERFGTDVSLQAVHRYNPELNTNGLAQKWRDIFEETRKRFLDDVTALPIANRSARMRKLQTALEKAEARVLAASGDDFLAASAELRAILEQGAKEMGGLLTNVRKVEGQVEHTTPEERRNKLEDRIAEALERRKQAAGAPATKH